MRLSELLYRAACLTASKIKRDKRRAHRAETYGKSVARGRSEKGLVWIPNRIRKRFGMAER